MNMELRNDGCPRIGEELTLEPILNKENVNTKVNEKIPYVSFLATNYNIPVITEAQEWFEACMRYILIIW